MVSYGGPALQVSSSNPVEELCLPSEWGKRLRKTKSTPKTYTILKSVQARRIPCWVRDWLRPHVSDHRAASETGPNLIVSQQDSGEFFTAAVQRGCKGQKSET